MENLNAYMLGSLSGFSSFEKRAYKPNSLSPSENQALLSRGEALNPRSRSTAGMNQQRNKPSTWLGGATAGLNAANEYVTPFSPSGLSGAMQSIRGLRDSKDNKVTNALGGGRLAQATGDIVGTLYGMGYSIPVGLWGSMKGRANKMLGDYNKLESDILGGYFGYKPASKATQLGNQTAKTNFVPTVNDKSFTNRNNSAIIGAV